MAIFESGEMYLENILELKQRKGNVRSVDLVENMNLAKSSVSEGINSLKEKGYITVDESGFLGFTESGLEIAERIYDRHKILTKHFVNLGVSHEIAEKDACKIEHVISDETFAVIKTNVEKL